MHGSLVDDEQYPRNDIDIYTVRRARNSVACLQNDHKEIMKQIESKLHEVHAQARVMNDHQTAGGDAQGRGNGVSTAPRVPFAKVNLVDQGSPADSAGLKVGDEIVQFGSVVSGNFESMQTIATVVQHSKSKPMVIRVIRNQQEVRVSLTPKTWSGRGLLGCNIVPIPK